MKKITFSEVNTFDEQSQVFLESKLAQRLIQKYKLKPFQERFNNLRWATIIISMLCHFLAIIASSTFIYSKIIAIIRNFQYSMIIAGIISFVVLCIIEILKRDITQKLFQDFYQFGTKYNYTWRMLLVILLISTSTLFSYYGGFDVVQTISTPPSYIEPAKQNTQQIKSDYTISIQKAKDNAESFKQSRTWKGKLSEQDAKRYSSMLHNIEALQQQMLNRIATVENQNREDIIQSKIEFEKKSNQFNDTVRQKGSGLAHISIIGELLLILCLWFLEFFDFRTISQYAILENDKSSNQTIIKQDSNPGNNTQQQPIGFFTKQQKQQQVKNQLPQGITQKTQASIIYTERHTIEHKGKHYTIARINNFIREYQKRIKQSEIKLKKYRDKGDINRVAKEEMIINNRVQQLQYWLDKKQELVEKMNT